MTKTIHLLQGEKAKIFSRNFSSIPINYHFQAKATKKNLEGEIEIRGSRWIFRTPPVTKQLQTDNVVHAGFWDTFFSVSVIAHCDLEVTIPKRKSDSRPWLIWLVLAALVIVLAVTILNLT